MMRLRITLVAMMAACSLLATVAVSAPAIGLAGIVPGGTKGGGYFYTSPAEPLEVGQSVTLAAMFASSTSGKNVTFYKQDPAGDPTEFVAYAVKKANSNGNAYIDGYVVNGDQNWFAVVDAANETEVEELTPTEPPRPTPTAWSTRSRAAARLSRHTSTHPLRALRRLSRSSGS